MIQGAFAAALMMLSLLAGSSTPPPGRPIETFRFERVEVASDPAGLFDGAWSAAFPAKAQTCEYAVRNTLIHAMQGGWNIDRPLEELRAVSVAGGNRSPCYVVLYVKS